jgi:hypothetical protein
VLTELFANQPQTTITSGGTDAPAAGTTQTLTPASGSVFPAVSAASHSQFHIADPADPSELIAVTQTGSTWTVTRGAEGTAPVRHQAGWTALQVVTAGALRAMVQVLDAKAFGAKGDGNADDTSALSAWIDAIDQADGTFAFLPPGRYMISGPLPAISVDSVVILGCGWSYTASQYGSVIAALASYTSSSPMLSLAGEGNRLEGICVDGGGYAATLISVTGGHAQLTRIQTRHVAANGTCVAIRSGGISCWITNSVINGFTTSGNIGLSLDDTDAIILGCKWDNNYVCLEMLDRAGGAQIIGCHFTPGSAVGQNAIWVNGSCDNVLIANCRFDNSIGSPVQISPGDSTRRTSQSRAACSIREPSRRTDTPWWRSIPRTTASTACRSRTTPATARGPTCRRASLPRRPRPAARPQIRRRSHLPAACAQGTAPGSASASTRRKACRR